MIIISGADNLVDCPICKGAGRFPDYDDPEEGRFIPGESCPECGGSGKLDRNQGYRSSLD